MKHVRAWIAENVNPELQNAKNATGFIMIVISAVLFFGALVDNATTDTPFIIGAVLYAAGLILIVIPRRKRN